ncbi:MAG: hypothetical protein ACK4NA_12730 [Alphaproteobacteria bacterium]
MTDLFPETAAPTSDIVDYRKTPVYRRETNDWYVEPEWAVEALIASESFVPGAVYDPACGGGTIPRVFARHGFRVLGSDIVDRNPDLPEGGFIGRDFLRDTADGPIGRPDERLHIVSNPPFKHAEAFARRALGEANGKVALLLPLAFLESEGRLALWRETPLTRVLVFGPRVSMPPGHLSKTMKTEGGKVAFAWFVWTTYAGPAVKPELGWLTRP